MTFSSYRRPYFDLFLISFLILFLELACIRYLGSTVVFLTFFTNIILIACFLGMSIGCLTASRKQDFMQAVIPLLLVTVGLAVGVLWAYDHFGQWMIDVGGQSSPQLIYFGTEYRAKDISRFVIPIEVVGGVFYTLTALVFVGLGQVLGRTFTALPNRIGAYSVNLLGSLVGIGGFALTSSLGGPPLFWFGLSLLICLFFVRRFRVLQAFAALGILSLIAWNTYGSPGGSSKTLWSPYYKIQYEPQTGLISTNNISHQEMISVRKQGPAYALPHLLNRDSGGQPFQDVMIIGAGSGNDVAAALAYGAGRVDAVEIDPTINRIGRAAHPDHPYDDPRVRIHLNDGRNFARETENAYDLIVYALVDSLVLHSGYSSLRLESFLFTREAFQDMKARLKPGGVFAMYNYYRQGWVVGRLAKMAEEVFGSKPLVISLPYQEKITPQDNQANHITFLLVGNGPEAPVARMARTLKEKGFFWIHEEPERNASLNGFGSEPPGGEIPFLSSWRKIGAAAVETEGIDRVPEDDWPFLYLKTPAIPAANFRGMILMAGISLILLFTLAPVRNGGINGRMFFLGAGFMLLETKGVVHMALLFGSTWVVNSVVFAAILVMSLGSSLFVLKLKPRHLAPYYLGLFAALLANALIPMRVFLGLPETAKILFSCGVIFVPIFFAGVIFTTAFRESRSPDVDFGSNIGGIILGGLSEYFSLILGFEHLAFLALGFYFLSAVFQPKALKIPIPASS
jgi:SAM-dependent methyltransferase